MNTQTEYQAEVAAGSAIHRKITQRELVLRRLQERAGEWVPMPDLVRASGAYAVHSRIADLRNPKWGGHQIEHRNEWRDGVCCSEYRLVIHDQVTSTVHSD